MIKLSLLVVFLMISNLGYAQDKDVEILVNLNMTDKDHKPVGQVSFKDSPFGLLIVPKLTSLPPGLHGFHLHEHPRCDDHGMGAGGHFDPTKSNSHLGPYADGHLGDLPALYVAADGTATLPVLAPRLKISQLKGLTLMIHAGGDNYSNQPPLGGGGARIACGAIQ